MKYFEMADDANPTAISANTTMLWQPPVTGYLKKHFQKDANSIAYMTGNVYICIGVSVGWSGLLLPDIPLIIPWRKEASLRNIFYQTFSIYESFINHINLSNYDVRNAATALCCPRAGTSHQSIYHRLSLRQTSASLCK
ncbi:hypothetical protein EVA_12770 [gut metagenome]|uniref:Uncharacterized protein n=1 Tax=gut metagenome TaxID=749906 RepID=J9CGH8_9ZZZZ